MSGIRVFRDDIEELITLLTNNGFHPELSNSDIIFDSLDEVIQRQGNSPSRLNIDGKKDGEFQSVSIRFDEENVYISSFGSTTAYSVSRAVSDLLKEKISIHYKTFNPRLYGILALGILPFYWVVSYTNTEQLKLPLLWIWVFVASACIISLLIRSTSYGVSLLHRHEYGFWKRNKDKLMVSICSTMAGIGLTLLFQYLSGKCLF